METLAQKHCPYCHIRHSHGDKTDGKTLHRNTEWWDWIRQTRKRKQVGVYIQSPEARRPRLAASIYFRDSPEAIFRFRIYYCPLCGRRLGGDDNSKTNNRRSGVSLPKNNMATTPVSQQKSQLSQVADSTKSNTTVSIPQEDSTMYQITISGNTLDELKQNVTSIAHNLGAVPAKVDTSAPAEKSKKKAAPAPKEADPEPEAEEEAEPVTKVHVQQAMKAVLEAGHKDEMATLMRDTFNANKLSELSQDDYPAFVDALKEMA